MGHRPVPGNPAEPAPADPVVDQGTKAPVAEIILVLEGDHAQIGFRRYGGPPQTPMVFVPMV